MALKSLKNQNIQDTFQKIVQTDGTNLADGTGSLLPISFNGNNVIISGSLTATAYSISSSVVDIQVATLSGSTNFGNSSDDTHTFKGTSTLGGTTHISGSKYYTSGSSTNQLLGLAVTGSILPGVNNLYDLGSPTSVWKDLWLSENSMRFVSSSGEVTRFRQKDAKALIEGKPIKQTTAVGGTDVFIRVQSILHETANNHYIKQTVAGIWDFIGPGGNILTINAQTPQHTFTLQGTNSKLILAGSISASKTTAPHIIGGTTSFGSNKVTINGSSGNISASGELIGIIRGGTF